MPEPAANTTLPRRAKDQRSARCRWLSVVLALLFSSVAGAEVLLIGGNGAAEPLLERLCSAYDSQAPEVQCRLVSPPLGSSGGIKALSVGKIDLAIVVRPLTTAEKVTVGRSFVLGATPFVIATNGGQRRYGFTRDELAAVYSGRLLHWDDGEPIRLVLRTRDDSDTAQLRSLSPALNTAVVVADQRDGMTFARDDMDTLGLLKRVRGSLGPTTLGLLKTTAAPLTVLPIDGVAPSLDNLRNGSYPWRRTLLVVLAQPASPAAERFAAFLRSAPAAELMRRNGYVPAAP